MTKIEMLQKDIEALRKCIKLVMGTKSYLHIDKATVLNVLHEQIERLENRVRLQGIFIEQLKSQ